MGKVYGYIRVSTRTRIDSSLHCAAARYLNAICISTSNRARILKDPNIRVWYADSGATISYTSRA